MRQINTRWIEQMKQEMAEYKQAIFDGTVPKPIKVTSQSNICSSWLIGSLANHNIPFKVINLGAGVKQITTETDICPKCHGTGKC
jgi:hypothetical protein